MEISQVVYSSPVIEFVAVANEYCSFAENAVSFSKRDFLQKSARILPLLYYKASLLPVVDSAFEEGNEKYVSENQYEFIRLAIVSKLGSHNDYQEVYDPVYRDSNEASYGSLAEDIADIYQDLKDFIMVYRVGTVEIMQEALFEIRTGFEQYWGQRLVNALRVIHSLITGDDPLEDENTEKPEDEIKRDTSNWIISQRQQMWNEDE
jgi:hypothetical protein